MIYTSLKNDKIKNIKKLNEKKYRDEFNEFLIEGEHLVLEAYKKGYLKTLILEENTNIDIDVEKIFVTKEILKNISNLTNPPKIMGICKKVETSLNLDTNRILILDNVQDPGNLGTIIRSSVAFDIDTLILSGDCVSIYNPKVLRATQGMIFNLNIVISDNLIDTVKSLLNNNYKVYATKVNGGNELKNVEKVEKFAIIMGNEGNGVSSEILSLCSDYIYIDMNEACESLNVGVATGIILYEFKK